MSEPTERTVRQAVLPPEVAELLTAIRDAADPAGLDVAGLVHRMIHIQVRLDGILTTARLDAQHPDLPPLVGRAIADATAALRELGSAPSL